MSGDTCAAISMIAMILKNWEARKIAYRSMAGGGRAAIELTLEDEQIDDRKC